MTSTSSNRKPARAERISLRTTSKQRHLLEQAAEATGKTLTSFILEAAHVEAQRALADPRRLFLVNDEQWAAFMEALDAPVSYKPGLDRLLNTPSILE